MCIDLIALQLSEQVVSGDRDRLVLPSGRGPVNGRAYENTVSQRCVPNGYLET